MGKIKKTVTKWSSCTGAFGLTFKVHFITSPTVSISHVSGTTGAKGHLKGNKISIKISGTGLASTCKATVSGTSVPAKYVNGGHSFNVNSGHAKTFHFKSATGGCLGAFATSDTGYIAVNYVASTPARLTIS